MSPSIWTTLDLDPTDDERDIRRAYARRLKEVHPEDDPEGFKALREAYDRALAMARGGMAPAAPTDADAPDDRVAAIPVAHPDSAPSGRLHDEDDLQRELSLQDHRTVTHDQACRELEDFIRQPQVDPEDVLDKLLAILRSPAMDSLVIHARTEQWLHQLINSRSGTIGSIVDPVIAYFRWNEAALLERRLVNPRAWRLRDAHNDQAWFRGLAKGPLNERRAYFALMREPTRRNQRQYWFKPQLAYMVRVLLRRIRTECPANEARLDADAVAYWDDVLERPQMSKPFYWIAGLAAVFIGLVSTLGAAKPLMAPVNFAIFAALAFTVVGFIRLSWVFLVDWPLYWASKRRTPPSPNRIMAAVKRSGKPWSRDHGAFLALSGPATLRQRLTPGLAGRIKRLLRSARAHNPDWLIGLDPLAVARWDKSLSRPRIGLATATAAIVISAIMLLLTLIISYAGPGSIAAGIILWIGLLILLIGLRGLVLFLIEWPIFLMRRRMGARPPAQLTPGRRRATVTP